MLKIIVLICALNVVSSQKGAKKKGSRATTTSSRHDCSTITCGAYCQGRCGWSSLFHRCMPGFHTSHWEMNSGPGCTSTTTTYQNTTTYPILITPSSLSPTSSTVTTTSSSSSSTISSSSTSTISSSISSTSASASSSLTATLESIISSQVISPVDSHSSSDNSKKDIIFPVIGGIIATILLMLALFIYTKRAETDEPEIVQTHELFDNHLSFDNPEYHEEIKHTTSPHTYETPVTLNSEYKEIKNKYQEIDNTESAGFYNIGSNDVFYDSATNQ